MAPCEQPLIEGTVYMAIAMFTATGHNHRKRLSLDEIHVKTGLITSQTMFLQNKFPKRRTFFIHHRA